MEESSTGKHKRTYVGEGGMPYEDVFSELLRDGFCGVASIEAGAIHFKEEGNLAFSRHVKNLNKILTRAREAQ